MKNSSMALLESNEDDLMLDKLDEVDELNEEDTTLLLVTELTTEEEDRSDEDEEREPVSVTFCDTLRSEAKADSDFSTLLEMELAPSSTISFSLLEP